MEKYFLYLTSLSSHFAYGITFGVLVACGLGFPLPEDIPLIATGYLIWEGTMEWVPSLIVTMSGVLIGDSILFWIGKNAGKSLLKSNRIQTLFKPERIRRTKAYFRKYGAKIIFFARFVAGFRAVAFFMAGAMKVKYHRFILLDGLAALLSVPLWILLGYGFGHWFGDELTKIFKSMKEVKMGVTLLIVLALLVFSVQIYRKYRMAKIIRGS